MARRNARCSLAEACLVTKRKCSAIEVYTILKKLDENLAARLFELSMK